MVRLRKTPQLKEKLHRLVGTSKSDQLGNELPLKLLEAVQAHLDDEQQADWVHHSLLVKVAKWNRSREQPLPEYSLRALIRGSEVYIEPVVPKARSPELEAILAPILLARERESYTSLITSSAALPSIKDAHDPRSSAYAGPDTHWDFQTASVPSLSVKQEWEAVRRELSATANVLASMAAVATAVWYAAGNIELVQKVLMSLFGALAIGAIEAFLYIRFFQQSRAAKKPPGHGNKSQKARRPIQGSFRIQEKATT